MQDLPYVVKESAKVDWFLDEGLECLVVNKLAMLWEKWVTLSEIKTLQELPSL